MQEVGIGKRAWAAGTQQRINAEAKVERRESSLRKPGKLKEKHVPTTAELAKVSAEIAEHHAGMRDVEDSELGDALGVEDRGAPRDGGAPVVTGEEKFFGVELIGDSDDVGGEQRERVGRGASWFAGSVVAALIGNHNAKAGGSERLDLFLPGIPEFGEAMEKNNQRTAGRSGGNRMKFDLAVYETQIRESRKHSPRVYAEI